MIFNEKTKETNMSKKHNTNDVGYGTKVTALNDMGIHNEDFDLLDDMFIGIDPDEVDVITDDLEYEDDNINE
jgi:hypothetical protein|tara:strand:+ start:195 stop:410 length:216 start_codon:yes stop_codon:yes gene_type:complete